MIKLGLIGVGKWGKNYLETVKKISSTEISVVCKKYNDTLSTVDLSEINSVVYNWKDVINDKSLSGVIIATPPDTHYEIAKAALENDLPVLLEKPVCLDLDSALRLQECSEKYKDTPILVNNTHLFAPAYETLIKLIDKTQPLTKIISSGCNWGPFRNYSTLYDYGPHDIGMCLYLMQTFPEITYALETDGLYDFTLKFKNKAGTTADIIVGNKSEKKYRCFMVQNPTQTLIYDDTVATKLTINNQLMSVSETPALQCVLDKFIASFFGYKDKRFDFQLNIDIIKVLDQVEKMCKRKS